MSRKRFNINILNIINEMPVSPILERSQEIYYGQIMSIINEYKHSLNNDRFNNDIQFFLSQLDFINSHSSQLLSNIINRIKDNYILDDQLDLLQIRCIKICSKIIKNKIRLEKINENKAFLTKENGEILLLEKDKCYKGDRTGLPGTETSPNQLGLSQTKIKINSFNNNNQKLIFSLYRSNGTYAGSREYKINDVYYKKFYNSLTLIDC